MLGIRRQYKANGRSDDCGRERTIYAERRRSAPRSSSRFVPPGSQASAFEFSRCILSRQLWSRATGTRALFSAQKQRGPSRSGTEFPGRRNPPAHEFAPGFLRFHRRELGNSELFGPAGHSLARDAAITAGQRRRRSARRNFPTDLSCNHPPFHEL